MPTKSKFPPVEVSNIPLHKKILNAIEGHIEADQNSVAMMHYMACRRYAEVFNDPSSELKDYRNEDILKICAENPAKRITYKELRRQTASVATYLSKRGFGHHDVCCLVLPNSIEFAVAYLAALECGGSMSGASAMFTDYELGRQFIDSRCSLVVTDEQHLEKVLKATERIPKIQTIICVRETAKPLKSGVIDWAAAVSTRAEQIPSFRFDSNDTCLLPYSSGTTGSPKGVMLSHRNFGTMMNIFITHYEKRIIPHFLDAGEVWNGRKETLIVALPMYHLYGCGLLHQCLLQGLTAILMTKFDPLIFLSSIEKFKPKILNLVPPLILFLAKSDVTKKFDLSSCRFALTGAAPCGKDLGDEFLKKFPNIRFLMQAYGMTECGMASHLPAVMKRDNFVACGSLAATFEQKIVDVATGREITACGERGEIWVRGPTVMKGYLNRPDATDETIDKEGWLHTGDIGYVSEIGELYVVDRLKELIKVKGLQVPPAELEDLLLSHPGVADVAVIGITDGKGGELPKAFVVRRIATLSEQDVKDFVAEKVSAYKHLGAVEFVSEIPKAPSGKIFRRFLRDRENQKAKI